MIAILCLFCVWFIILCLFITYGATGDYWNLIVVLQVGNLKRKFRREEEDYDEI